MELKNLKYLTLKLTNKCNLKCIMCGQVYSSNRMSKDEISIDNIFKILDEAKNIKHVYLFGGEPLLYRKIEKLLEKLASSNISVQITTNGTLIEKYAARIVSNGVLRVEISVDSYDRNNLCRIRGRDIYDNILAGIRRLNEEKKKQQKKYPFISINFVILPYNFKELENFVQHVKSNMVGVDHVFFQYPMLTHEEQGVLQSKINEEEFGVSCESWKWFANRNQMFTDDEISYVFKELKKLEDCAGVEFKKVESEEELFKMFRGEIVDRGNNCECPFTALTILPNGDAVFCPDFPDIRLGNINEMTVDEIWNGENSEKFRNHLISKGNYPICKSCFHIDERLNKNY